MAAQDALDFILNTTSLILTTHESPDADGLGAEYALCGALKRLGRNVRILNSSPVPEKFRFIDKRGMVDSLASGAPSAASLEGASLLVLDTSDLQNIGLMADSVLPQVSGVFFIDHHEINEEQKTPGYADPRASSTCEMVWSLIGQLGAQPEPDEAEALFTGISYDTGSFSYQKTGEGAFAAALSLVKAGAIPASVHSALHENSSAAALLLMKASLSSLELRSDNRVSIQTLRKEIFAALGARYEDAEDLINIPLRVKEMEISILFKENQEGVLRCSLRSKGSVNVAAIAQVFGGGGHKTAAGFKCGPDLEAAKTQLLQLVEAVLRGDPLPKPERLSPHPPKKQRAT